MGENLKFSVTKLLYNTPHEPYVFWCFAAYFLDKLREYLSKKLVGKCGYELIKGDNGDMRILMFPWFVPIWYYNPSLFPT